MCQSRKPLHALGVHLASMFLPLGKSRESCWVEGPTGTKACRLEVRPSQERGGAGFELGRGERDVPGAGKNAFLACVCGSSRPTQGEPGTDPQTSCAARTLELGQGPSPRVEAQSLGGVGLGPLIKAPWVQLAQELGFNMLG